MKTPLNSFLAIIALSVASCEKPKELPDVGSVSGKYLKLAEGTTAIGGDLDGAFHFMIIPDPLGEPILAGQSFGGAGYRWNGWIRFPEHEQIGFEAKCDRTTVGGSILIGSATFDLMKGEVFYLPRNSDPKQILGSKAGHRDDPQNAKRLAEVLKHHKGEQAGAGQPATAPESNSEGSHKPQPEAEGRSQ